MAIEKKQGIISKSYNGKKMNAALCKMGFVPADVKVGMSLDYTSSSWEEQ